jgi:hypothetical protein
MSKKTATKIKRRLVHNSSVVTIITGVLFIIASSWILSLVRSTSISTPKSILSSSNRKIERGLKSSIDDTFDNITVADLPGAEPNQKTKIDISTPVSVSIEDNVRALNAYTQHYVTVKSLTQELYGISDFPEGTTTTAFQEIYDEHVESYFSLEVDRKLFLDSKITISNVLMPSIADRYLRRQRRNLEIFQDFEGKHEGSSVFITYDQQLSYYFPIDGGTLALETLVTLPFLTESSRTEFNSKLKYSDDNILQDVIGVSEVDLPPQSSTIQPVNSPTQLPIESPTKLPTPFPTIRSPPAPPKPAPIRTKSPIPPPSKSPVPLPTNPPVVVPTARPSPIPSKANPLRKDADSGGISGLIIIGSIMALLFIIFTINMKYCMGEYVD